MPGVFNSLPTHHYHEDEMEKPYLEEVKTVIVRHYNPKYGDDRICKCGHSYYRHFDTYEDMYPIGCKYCGSDCESFVEKETE
jgi:hypothetical protein